MNKEDAIQEIMTQLTELAEESGSDTAVYIIGHERLLNFQVSKFVEDVLVYCNRRDFPKPLIYTAVEMLNERISSKLATSQSQAPLSEVKMDDVTFKWNYAAINLASVFSEELFNSITPKLNLYRKVKSR